MGIKRNVLVLATALFCGAAQVLAAQAEAFTPAQLYERVAPGVVTITAQDDAGKTWVAGGSVIDPAGVILTSYHVVSGKRQIHVRWDDGTSLPLTQVIGYDVLKDLAVFTVQAEDVNALPLGSTAEIRVGEPVYVVGHAQGKEKAIQGGVFSARQMEFGSTWLLVSAAVGPGSSGSPLVNRRGEVIGVVSSQRQDDVRISRVSDSDQIPGVLARGVRVPAADFLDPAARPREELLSRGLQAFAEGRTREAVGYLEQLVGEAAYPEALVFLGASYLESGEYSRALDYLGQSLSAFPEEPLLYRYLAGAYTATGAHRNAVENFQKYLHLESRSAHPNHELISATHLALGYAYLSLAEFDKALMQVEAVREVGDERVLPDAYLLEGLLRNCQADLQAAYQCVDQLRKMGKQAMADQLLQEISIRRRR